MFTRSYKYRLYPNKSQAKLLEATLNICSNLYNDLLAIKRDNWKEENISVSKYDLDKTITSMKSQNEDLKSVHSQVLQNISERVDLSYQSFFRRLKSGGNPGYPRFKKFGRYKSFTFPQAGYKIIDDSVLKISKIGLIKIKLHRPIPSKPKRLHIKRSSCGKWWAIFVCEVCPPDDRFISSDKIYGFDLGLSSILTRSDGKIYRRKRFYKQDAKDICRLQRKCERNNYNDKSKVSLAKAYSRSNSRRNDYLHKLSIDLVRENQVMVFEDIEAKSLMKGNLKSINKSLKDASWGKLIRNIQYKAEEAGRSVILVDPRNTSKECSSCGRIKNKKLQERTHDCECGISLSRDHNAAINILRRGLSSLVMAKAIT